MTHQLVSRVSLPVLVTTSLFAAALAAEAQLPAFPGAEGFGRFATGGRGGTVYHVTTTNDSGPGSFRDAVSVSGRTVVFDVGGIINYLAPRYAPKPNITIAGQTAPGDGVTIYGNGLSFSGSHNNICRFIRVREGINGDSGTDAMGIANGHDMIFDHISDSWGRDETFSVNGSITNITIQSAIISQGLQTHSAGGLIQADGGVSILRCLYIDNDTRNPKVKFVNEFVNNFVCNWETIGYNMGGDSAGDSYANAFNNYFIRGPNSSTSAFGGGNANFHIYATNNWLDSNKDGLLNGTELPFASYGPMDLQTAPFAYPITNAVPPLTALKWVVSDVGASQRRDSVDERLLTEATSWGVLGETISSEFAFPMNGPGVINGGPAPTDTDQDGMPDYWELGTGSNPNVANNNDPSPSGSGYTRLEDYLNWLAEPHGMAMTNATCEVDLRQFTRGFTNFSPVYSVANPTNGTVSLSGGGRTARFVPPAGYTGPASFNFTVVDADGSTLTRLMNLFFTPLAPTGNVIWRGDAVSNNWDVLGDLNWFDATSLLFPFHNGDTVTFDDSGYNAPALNLVGSLQPAQVTVNSTRDYTLAGSGSLDGAMALRKSGSGAFRLSTTNSYSGNTTVTNGSLLVNGTLVQSAVTVLSGGAAGGAGRVGNGLLVQSGGSVIPGDGIGAPGLLTVTNDLTENGNVTNRFDLTDDPTGTARTNDQIKVVGNLNLAGTNIIQVTLLNGPLANGDYILFTYSGSLLGGLSNLTVIGANGVLINPPNAIGLHVDNTRAPANLTWLGNGVNNIWDTGTNANWMNGANQDRFYFGDTVLFDNSGSTSPAINLVGALSPASVTVDSTNNYSFTGAGKLSGTGFLTKTNSGLLTITTTNDHTGPTLLGGGMLAVSRLANGGTASGIGASGGDPTNLVFCGGALRYTGGSVATDRQATLASNAVIDVASSSATLTANGTLSGNGALVKAGAGTLTIATNNTYAGGTIISNGAVTLANTTARDSGLGGGTVVFNGGTLQLFGYGGSTGTDFGTFNRPLSVPPGQTGSLLTPPRYTMSSTLTGSGTLNLTVDYVRGGLSGNWATFGGVLNVLGRSTTASNEFRIANALFCSNATVILNDHVIMDRSGSSSTVEVGALGGSSGATVGPGSSSSSGTTYRVGWNNNDATFAGLLKNDGTTTVVKVGAGKWTLTGANTWSGGLTISNGTVFANNASGSALGSGAVVLYGGTLAGTGSVGAPVTVNSGAAIAPGSNNVGTLTINGALTLNSGALLNFELGPTAASDKLVINGALALGGVLNVANVAGFGAGTYTLATYSGALTGTLPLIGAKPAGFSCTVNTNTASQVRLVVQTQTPPVFGAISVTGSNAVFSGSGGPTNVAYYVLTSTNLSLPLANWIRVATNAFDATGAFAYTNLIVPGTPQQFYRLQLP